MLKNSTQSSFFRDFLKLRTDNRKEDEPKISPTNPVINDEVGKNLQSHFLYPSIRTNYSENRSTIYFASFTVLSE